MASDAVGRSIIQLAENQSHSLDFILVGQQSQMDAYREMTHSNQAREDDALFAGIEVYDGEDPSRFESWLDTVKQACNMTDRNLHKELMKKSTGAIRVIGTMYPNIPLSSAGIHGHPQSSLGATLRVRMSTTAYGNPSTMSSVWPIGASRLNLRPHALSI